MTQPRGPAVHEIILATDAARKLTHPELMAIGVVAQWGPAWTALVDIHAQNQPRQPTIQGKVVTLTTRISDRHFWALPIGWRAMGDTEGVGFWLAIQKEEGMPVYKDKDGEDWVLQIAPDGSLYRMELT